MKTRSILNSSLFLRNTLYAISLGILITGCSEHKKPATQIVAKVNNDEISVHQVNNAMAQYQNIPADKVDKVRSEVLTKLINQQLAVQQAEKHKIDRSVEVMMMLDAAKREILTRAYLNQVVAAVPPPSEEEVRKFYQEHPELFSQRRIYTLQQIVLTGSNLRTPELRQMAGTKSMEEIAAWLKKEDMAFMANAGTRAAEQIALPVLAQIASYKDGQTGLVETPEGVTIVHLLASKQAPVEESVALQQIPKFLATEKAKLAINADLERLKTMAKIEYLNEPSKTAELMEQKGSTAPGENVKPQNQASAESEVDRGVKGL